MILNPYDNALRHLVHSQRQRHLLARGKRILAAAEEKNFAAVFGENTDSTVSDSLTRAQAVESELNSKIQSDADARRSFAEGGR